MQEFLAFVVKHLVEHPDQVIVSAMESEGRQLYKLSVGSGDLGRVIGKEGRTAKALRTILMAASARKGQQASLEILE
jgi:predicted RNA-binding protein YlqC (UPF0109 family)